MTKFMKVATSTFLAIAIGATALSAPASAGKRERDVLLGIAGGLIGGAIIANEINRNARSAPRYYEEPAYVQPRAPEIYVEPRRPRRARHFDYDRPRYRRVHRDRLTPFERHVRRCERRYRSYDRRSDTFIGYDGIERQCRL